MRRRRFTVLEMAAAGVVLGIMLTVFAGMVRQMRRMSDRFVVENRCVLVLDCAVERLAAETARTEARAQALLAMELARAEFPGRSGLRPRCEPVGDRLALAIEDADGRVRGRILLPWENRR